MRLKVYLNLCGIEALMWLILCTLEKEEILPNLYFYHFIWKKPKQFALLQDHNVFLRRRSLEILKKIKREETLPKHAIFHSQALIVKRGKKKKVQPPLPLRYVLSVPEPADWKYCSFVSRVIWLQQQGVALCIVVVVVIFLRSHY